MTMNLMMKNKLIPLAIVFFVILGFSSTIQAYIVKKGDTLSEIAYKYISPKVYGKNSSINKILALKLKAVLPLELTFYWEAGVVHERNK
jgi:hypothetical protein